MGQSIPASLVFLMGFGLVLLPVAIILFTSASAVRVSPKDTLSDGGLSRPGDDGQETGRNTMPRLTATWT